MLVCPRSVCNAMIYIPIKRPKDLPDSPGPIPAKPLITGLIAIIILSIAAIVKNL